jgi:hypothetical protein
MIDTITIWINVVEDLPPGKDYIQSLRNAINLTKEGYKHSTGNRYYIGKFDNLTIVIDGNNVSITGSLAKYYQDNNLAFFGRTELYLALKQLSAKLGLNVERGRISRIDVADNLFLTQCPSKYIDLLGGIGKAEGRFIKQSYYIERSRSTAVFYDKKKELHKNDPPTLYALNKSRPNSNVLRYEVRFKCKLSQQFKFGSIKVALLHSSTFLKALAESWLNHYNKTTKVKQESFKDIQLIAQFGKMVEFKGIGALGGIEKVKKIIDKLRRENQWPYKPAYDLKKRLEALSNDTLLVDESPLIEELDAAILDSDIVKYYINN